MKKKFIIVLSILLILGLSAGLLAACDREEDTPSRPLRVDGLSVVDSNGNPVALRGTNLGGWLVQEAWLCPTVQTDSLTTMKTLYSRFGKERAEQLIDVYEDSWITEPDFKNIADLGLNAVRIPFTYMNFYNVLDDNGEALPPEQFSWREDAFARIDWAVSMCKKYGLYAILDLHGAVGSQNAKDHSGDTSGARLFDEDEYGAACRAKTTELWEAIARRYAGNVTVAAYDLLNEPEGRTGKTEEAQWNYYDELYDAVRAIDPDHIIMFEAVWEPGNLPKPSDYGWENAIYQYHHYNWTSSNLSNSVFYLLKVLAIDSGRTVPVFIGEFNAWGDSGRNGTSSQTDLQAVDGVLELYTGKGWHWTTWTYKAYAKSSSWGLYNGGTFGENGEEQKADPATSSFEEISRIWGGNKTADAFYVNEGLSAIVKKYAAAPFRVAGIEDATAEYYILGNKD